MAAGCLRVFCCVLLTAKRDRMKVDILVVYILDNRCSYEYRHFDHGKRGKGFFGQIN
jgi:hypothetical protein